MIQQTTEQHEGMPIFRACGCIPFSHPHRYVPCYVDGNQVGYLHEQSMTVPRRSIELKRLTSGGRFFGSYREAAGMRWTGD